VVERVSAPLLGYLWLRYHYLLEQRCLDSKVRLSELGLMLIQKWLDCSLDFELGQHLIFISIMARSFQNLRNFVALQKGEIFAQNLVGILGRRERDILIGWNSQISIPLNALIFWLLGQGSWTSILIHRVKFETVELARSQILLLMDVAAAIIGTGTILVEFVVNL
jgi:hypothetical protein